MVNLNIPSRSKSIPNNVFLPAHRITKLRHRIKNRAVVEYLYAKMLGGKRKT